MGVDFRLYGRDGDALVKEMSQFKYLGINLDQYDSNWSEILQNIRRARKVWVCLRNILPWEGVYTQVLEVLYWAVLQAVILFGLGSWYMSKAMI